MAHIQAVNGKYPLIGKDCFLAENATVVGDVQLGEGTSIWFNAVVRGDVNRIEVGKNSNIQDGAIIHCTYLTADTKIGNFVSIGHNAIVHGCRLRDYVLVGMGAIVMDHAAVGEYAIIAAGAVVLENTIIEPATLYAGVPARKIKMVSDEMKMRMEKTANNYLMYSNWFK